MPELTSEQAIALAATRWWEGRCADDVVAFQLFQDTLCMDFADFHGAVQAALGRSVFAHEFGRPELLREEFLRDRPAPSFDDILALIPAEKRYVHEV